MIPIDQQIRRRNSLLASYSSSSISSANTIINTTTNNDIIRRRMSLPGSLRPLKKRRVVSITDFQDDSNININNINAALTLSTMNNSIIATKKKNVSWNDLNGNIIHSPQDDYHNHVFNERDIWYTREDYEEFLLDRVRTIECLRGMKRSNRSAGAAAADSCIRGLEPFHDTTTSKQYHTKKKLYHSTVIIEQVRQGMLGIKEPERFRFLVSPQSDLAILRAQELAVQDEQEVYPYRHSSSSSLFNNNYDNDDSSSRTSTSTTGEDDNNIGSTSQHHHHHQHQQQQSRRSSMSALLALQRQRRSSIIMNSNTGGAAAGGSSISNTYYNNIENGSSFDSNSTSSTTTARRNSTTNVTTATDSSSDINTTATKFDKNTPSLSLFTDSIRRFQEKNARRLMGIYAQNNNGEGVQQQSCSDSTTYSSSSDKMTNEGHNLFRYSVRRNSLLGMIGGAINANTNTTTTTATTVPTFTSSSFEQQQQTMQHQQQPVMETVPTCGRSNGVGGIGNNNNNSVVINSHRRQHHKQLIEGAMLAMRTTRFPIRRDTLSHLQQTHNHNHNNSQISGYHHHHTDNDVFPIPTDAFVFSQNARTGNSNDTTNNNGQQNSMTSYSTTVAQ